MSQRTWTGDKVEEASQQVGSLSVSTHTSTWGGRVTKRTTTTRHYDHAGRLVKEEVVVEDLSTGLPYAPTPWFTPVPHWPPQVWC